MSRTFFTADPQINHEFTASLRSFATTAEHDRHIANIWDATVRAKDDIWILGDTHVRDLNGTLDFYASRPGRKILVLGNHDAAHPAHRSWIGKMARYRTAFDEVVVHGQVRLPGGSKALVSHFPYDGDSQDADRYAQWRFRDLGQPIIHGHVHSKDRYTLSDAGTVQIHVGWDAWGRPVEASDVEALL